MWRFDQSGKHLATEKIQISAELLWCTQGLHRLNIDIFRVSVGTAAKKRVANFDWWLWKISLEFIWFS